MFAIGGAVGAFGVAAVKAASDVEVLQVQFETLTKSSEEAAFMLGNLREFAAKTPLRFPEVAQAARNLKAFGVASDDIIPTLRVLGDVSGATGNSLREIAEIYGKARVQGRLFAEDINQLTGRGIPVIEALKEEVGATHQSIRQLTEDGALQFEHLRNVMVKLANEDFAGGMQRQAETLQGMWSTFADNMQIIMADIGRYISEGLDLKGALGEMTEFAQAIQRFGFFELAGIKGNEPIGIQALFEETVGTIAKTAAGSGDRKLSPLEAPKIGDGVKEGVIEGLEALTGFPVLGFGGTPAFTARGGSIPIPSDEFTELKEKKPKALNLSPGLAGAARRGSAQAQQILGRAMHADEALAESKKHSELLESIDEKLGSVATPLTLVSFTGV